MGTQVFTIPQDASALITIHAAVATAHQDAPGLIATHKAIATDHQNAPGLIATHKAIAADHHAVYTDGAARAAVGGRIAYGAYSGDGGSARQMNTGFQCKKVVIQESASNNVDTIIIQNTSSSIEMITGAYPGRNDYCELHASNGFKVGSTGNSNGVNYTYVAIGVS